MASGDIVRRDATVARTDKPLSTTNPPRRTIYVDYTTSDAPPPPRSGGGSGGASGGGGRSMLGPGGRSDNRANAPVPSGLPKFLGNRRVIFGAWIAAMAIVTWDEWTVNGILPRPRRLWYTSLTFGILMLVSVADIMVPICNALAIGFVIQLLWQYYNGEGQFAGVSSGGNSGGAAQGTNVIPPVSTQ